jgi:hypothetical protein
MKNEFCNRLNMFQSSLGILNDSTRKSVWFQQDPQIFTTKVADAGQAVGNLQKFCQQQGMRIIGSAGDKLQERGTLTTTAHALAGALATWYEDQKDMTDLAKVNFPLSHWQHLSGEEIEEAAQEVSDLASAIIAGPQAAAAAPYDITPDSVKELDGEIESFDGVVSAPQQAISKRKSLTENLRDQFNAVEAKFVQIDRMILRFNGTAAGVALIAAYQAARTVRGYGIRHETDPAPSTGTANGGATQQPAKK